MAMDGYGETTTTDDTCAAWCCIENTHYIFKGIYVVLLCVFTIIFTRAYYARKECRIYHKFFIFFSTCASCPFLDDDEFDTNRLATAPRPGTSLRTATAHDHKMGKPGARPRTATGRALTGMVCISVFFCAYLKLYIQNHVNNLFF